jgi:sulfate permease, SulP family
VVRQKATKVFNEAVEGLGDVADYLKLDPVPPVWRELRGYSPAKLRGDFSAALMVAIVTIPQAVGFALITGLPVQAVLTTAVVGGLVCALFSTSRHLVFGPTNTLSILLAGALLTVAPLPLPPLQKALVIGLFIGAIQLSAGFFKLGNLTRFISRTVLVAYATAVGVLIATSQLGNLIGSGASGTSVFFDMLSHAWSRLFAHEINAATAAIGLTSLLALLLLKRLRPRWPEGLIVLGAAAVLSRFVDFGALGVPVVRDAGEVLAQVPLLGEFPLNEAGMTLVPFIASAALAAAILGMLEAVSITQSIAARSGQKINANQELIAMGAANLSVAAFGGIPGSASFVRSAVSHQSGGATQMAAILCSGLILGIVWLTAPLVNFIPVAALAATIIHIAFRLINRAQISIVRRATRSDAIVFWATLVAGLTLQLDTAVYVGVGISLALFLKKASAPALVEYAFNEEGQLAEIASAKDRGNAAISIVHVEGELFFGAADLFQEQVRLLADDDDIKIVILRMKNARHLDATSVMSLLQLHDYLRLTGRHLLISGINPEVENVLRKSRALKQIGPENVFPAEANLTMSTKRALLRASQLLQQLGAAPNAGVRIFYDRNRDNNAAVDAPSPVRDGDHDKPADYQI